MEREEVIKKVHEYSRVGELNGKLLKDKALPEYNDAHINYRVLLLCGGRECERLFTSLGG